LFEDANTQTQFGRSDRRDQSSDAGSNNNYVTLVRLPDRHGHSRPATFGHQCELVLIDEYVSFWKTAAPVSTGAAKDQHTGRIQNAIAKA
jgi:hypothetical protein